MNLKKTAAVMAVLFSVMQCSPGLVYARPNPLRAVPGGDPERPVVAADAVAPMDSARRNLAAEDSLTPPAGIITPAFGNPVVETQAAQTLIQTHPVPMPTDPAQVSGAVSSDHVIGELIVRFKDTARGFLDQFQDVLRQTGEALKEGWDTLSQVSVDLTRTFVDLGISAIEKLFPSLVPLSAMTEAEQALDAMYTLTFDESKVDIDTAASRLGTLAGWADYAEKNRLFQLEDSPVSAQDFEDLMNANFSEHWGLDAIEAKKAWELFDVNHNGQWDPGERKPGEGITVAVLDTGIYYNHSDLFNNIWVNAQEVSYAAGDRNHDGRISWEDADFNADGRVSTADLDGLRSSPEGEILWSAADQNQKVELEEIALVSSGLDPDGNGYFNDILGWNFVSQSNRVIDGNAHGTHVSGIVAGRGESGGMLGVAPYASLMPVKVLSDYGYGSDTAILRGIYYAVNQKADVINMSLGGPDVGNFKTYNDTIHYADQHGTLVVVAAGNSNDDASYYLPANTERAITVSSIHAPNAYDSEDRSYFSSYGPVVEVAAPGQAILSTTPYGYDVFSGTSMASPHVAGAVALLESYRGPLNYDAAVQSLQQGGTPFSSSVYAGHGVLNVYQTLLSHPSNTAKAAFRVIDPTPETLGVALDGFRPFELPLHAEGVSYRLDYAMGEAAASRVDPAQPEFNLTDDWQILRQGLVTEQDFAVPIDFTRVSFPYGTHSVMRLTVWDAEGNPYESRLYFYVADVTPPEGSISINAGAYRTSLQRVHVRLQITDAGSGIKDMSYFDGTQWSEWELFRAEKDVILPDSGLVRFKVRDFSGNEQIFEDQIRLESMQILRLTPGWNLMSFSVDPHMTLAEFRRQRRLDSTFRFALPDSDHPDQRREVVDEAALNLRAGLVVWILNDSTSDEKVRFYGRPGIDSILLRQGLNLISGFDKVVPVSELILNQSAFQGQVLQWEPSEERWVSASRLEPGRVYQVHSPATGALVFREQSSVFPLDERYQLEILSNGTVRFKQGAAYVYNHNLWQLFFLPGLPSFSVHLNGLHELEYLEYSSRESTSGMIGPRNYQFRMMFSKDRLGSYQITSYRGCEVTEEGACSYETLMEMVPDQGVLRQYLQFVTRTFVNWDLGWHQQEAQRTSLFYDFNRDVNFGFMPDGLWRPQFLWDAAVNRSPFIQISYSPLSRTDFETLGDRRISRVIHFTPEGKAHFLLRRGVLDVDEAALMGLDRNTEAFRRALADDLLVSLENPILSSTEDVTFSFGSDTLSLSTVDGLQALEARFGTGETVKNLRTEHQSDGRVTLSVPGLGGEQRIYEITLMPNGQLFLKLIKTKTAQTVTAVPGIPGMKVLWFMDQTYMIEVNGALYFSRNGVVSIEDARTEYPIQMRVSFSPEGKVQSIRQFASEDNLDEITVLFEEAPTGALRVQRVLVRPLGDETNLRLSSVLAIDYERFQTSFEKLLDPATRAMDQTLAIYSDEASLIANMLIFDPRWGFQITEDKNALVSALYYSGELTEITHRVLKAEGLPVGDMNSYKTYIYVRFGEFDFDPKTIDWRPADHRTTQFFRTLLKNDLILYDKYWAWPHFQITVDSHIPALEGARFSLHPNYSHVDLDTVYLGLNVKWPDGRTDLSQSILEYDEEGRLVIRFIMDENRDRMVFDVRVDPDEPRLFLTGREFVKKTAYFPTDLFTIGDGVYFDQMEDGTFTSLIGGRYVIFDRLGFAQTPQGLRLQIHLDATGNIESLDVWRNPALRQGLEGEAWVYRYSFLKGPSVIFDSQGDRLNLNRIEARPSDCPNCSFQPYLEIFHQPPAVRTYSLETPGLTTETIFGNELDALYDLDLQTGLPRQRIWSNDPARILFHVEKVQGVPVRAYFDVDRWSSDTRLEEGRYEILVRGTGLDISLEALALDPESRRNPISQNLTLNHLWDDGFVKTGSPGLTPAPQNVVLTDGTALQVQAMDLKKIIFRAFFSDGSRLSNLATRWDTNGRLLLDLSYPDGSQKTFRVVPDDRGVLVIDEILETDETEYRMKLDSGMTLITSSSGPARLLYQGKAYFPDDQGRYKLEGRRRVLRFLFDAEGRPAGLQSFDGMREADGYFYEITLIPHPTDALLRVPQEISQWARTAGQEPVKTGESYIFDASQGVVRDMTSGWIYVAGSKDSIWNNNPVLFDEGFYATGVYPGMYLGKPPMFMGLRVENGEIIDFGGTYVNKFIVLKTPGQPILYSMDWARYEFRDESAFFELFSGHTVLNRNLAIQVTTDLPTSIFLANEFESHVTDQIRLNVYDAPRWGKYVGTYALQPEADGLFSLVIPELGETYEGRISESGQLSLRLRKKTTQGVRFVHVYADDDLSAALNRAETGDRIQVHAGTYHGHFVLKPGVSIMGDAGNGTILDGDGLESPFVLMAQGDNTIARVTVTGSGSGRAGPSSAIQVAGNEVSVIGSIVRDNPGYGIFIDSGSLETLVSDVLFERNGVGVQLPRDDTRIEASRFVSNEIGINVLFGASPLIDRNTFTENTFASIYEYAFDKMPTRGYARVKNNTFQRNTEHGSHYGPALPPAAENQTDGNRILP